MISFNIKSSQYNNILSELSEKYGSDKGAPGEIKIHRGQNPYHSYTDIYDFFLNGIKNTALNVLECGIGTNNVDVESSMGPDGIPGASLRMWKDYFPNAQIVGIDIDPRIMFSEERIKTFVVDQTNPESIKKFKSALNKKFDFILDDGLHTYSAQITLFENMIDRLNDGGLYIIEDCMRSFPDLVKYFEKNKYQYLAVHGETKINIQLYDSFILIKK
jgi:hypothetical protein